MDVMLIKNINWKKVWGWTWRSALGLFVVWSIMWHGVSIRRIQHLEEIAVYMYHKRLPELCDSIFQKRYGTWWMTDQDFSILKSWRTIPWFFKKVDVTEMRQAQW